MDEPIGWRTSSSSCRRMCGIKAFKEKAARLLASAAIKSARPGDSINWIVYDQQNVSDFDEFILAALRGTAAIVKMMSLGTPCLERNFRSDD